MNILVPTLAHDISLLDRLVSSLDYPIDKKVIIKNGVDLTQWKQNNPDWIVIDKGKNLGVSASWNIASRIFPYEPTLIVNDDFWFQGGQLELICSSYKEHKECPTIHFTESEGYNCFVWNRSAMANIGLFDENLFAYYGDYDYRIRMRLLGLKPHIIGLKDEEITHGKPKSGGENYRKLLDEFDTYEREYYLRKWGAITDTTNNLTFKYPFNNPNNDFGYWELEKDRHKKIEYIWNDFVREGNTIYT